MRVKIGDLKNNLSRYIHKVNDEGEVIIICDRDNPVACLSPLALTPTAEWRAYRERHGDHTGYSPEPALRAPDPLPVWPSLRKAITRQSSSSKVANPHRVWALA